MNKRKKGNWFVRFIKWCFAMPTQERYYEDKYPIKMCANCGCEERMYYTERWCKKCRNE